LGVVGGILSAVGVALAVALYMLFPPPRTNVLLLGVDSRPGEGYVTRSDTIMLVTVDSGQPYVGMLSIPRDLYVDVPGHGYTRINAAHTYGESAAPGGGPRLVAQAIADNFGVPVHRTVRLNFQGFVAIVDAAGGVDIDVAFPITDTAYPTDDYGITTIHFDPGTQHMDGERALQYARTRHSSNDFKRAERQQQVVQALIRKLANPVNWWRLPMVYSAFSANVETDLTPIEAALLAPAVLRVGPDDFERRVLSRENSMVVNANVPGDPYLLAPNWPVVNPLVDEMFRN
jgi:LCP family protein required for cell wall assembly